jgi:hypothetical protein
MQAQNSEADKSKHACIASTGMHVHATGFPDHDFLAAYKQGYELSLSTTTHLPARYIHHNISSLQVLHNATHKHRC